MKTSAAILLEMSGPSKIRLRCRRSFLFQKDFARFIQNAGVRTSGIAESKPIVSLSAPLKIMFFHLREQWLSLLLAGLLSLRTKRVAPWEA